MKGFHALVACGLLLVCTCTSDITTPYDFIQPIDYDTDEEFRADTMAVRAILDTNGLYALSYYWVTDVDSGRISELDLRSRGLTRIPTAIESLTALRKCFLQNNFLTTLPEQIGKLRKLEVLYVFNNQLDSVPTELGNCFELRYLYLNDNRLTTLPATVGNLSHLFRVELQNNYIDSLPLTMTGLSRLDYVTVTGNYLCDISDSLAGWLDVNAYNTRSWRSDEHQRCRQLGLDTQRVAAIIERTGLDQPWRQRASVRAGRINSLDLSAVQAEHVDTALLALTGLEYLDLSRNSITAIPEGVDTLYRLIRLDLSGNNLSSLPGDW